jgi:hypothetical protein
VNRGGTAELQRLRHDLLVAPQLDFERVEIDAEEPAGASPRNRGARFPADRLRPLACDVGRLLGRGHVAADGRPRAIRRDEAAIPAVSEDVFRLQTDRRRVQQFVVGPHRLDSFKRERVTVHGETVIPLILANSLARASIKNPIEWSDVVSQAAQEHLREQRESFSDSLIEVRVVAPQLFSFRDEGLTVRLRLSRQARLSGQTEDRRDRQPPCG